MSISKIAHRGWDPVNEDLSYDQEITNVLVKEEQGEAYDTNWLQQKERSNDQSSERCLGRVKTPSFKDKQVN